MKKNNSYLQNEAGLLTYIVEIGYLETVHKLKSVCFAAEFGYKLRKKIIRFQFADSLLVAMTVGKRRL